MLEKNHAALSYLEERLEAVSKMVESSSKEPESDDVPSEPDLHRRVSDAEKHLKILDEKSRIALAEIGNSSSLRQDLEDQIFEIGNNVSSLQQTEKMDREKIEALFVEVRKLIRQSSQEKGVGVGMVVDRPDLPETRLKGLEERIAELEVITEMLQQQPNSEAGPPMAGARCDCEEHFCRLEELTAQNRRHLSGRIDDLAGTLLVLTQKGARHDTAVGAEVKSLKLDLEELEHTTRERLEEIEREVALGRQENSRMGEGQRKLNEQLELSGLLVRPVTSFEDNKNVSSILKLNISMEYFFGNIFFGYIILAHCTSLLPSCTF